jgi:hypothetical protein
VGDATFNLARCSIATKIVKVSKPSLGKRRDKYRLRRQLQARGQRSVFFSSLEGQWNSLSAGLKVIGWWGWRLLVELVRRSLRTLVIFTLKLVKRFESPKTDRKPPAQESTRLSAFSLNLKHWGQRFKQFFVNKQLIKKQFLNRQLINKLRGAPVFAWLLLTAICAVVVLAYSAVTRPSSSSVNCREQINGIWQTNLGEINLQEQAHSNKIIAIFRYQNIDRGTVNAKIEGELDYDTLEYSWTEQAEKGKPKTGGNGIFLFRNKCQEFYGNYGSISLQNRGFQGYLVKAIAIK